MNSGQEGVLAVREERAVQGGIEMKRETLIAATDEGLVTTLHFTFLCFLLYATKRFIVSKRQRQR